MERDFEKCLSNDDKEYELMKNYKKLKVWQNGIALVTQVYKIAKKLPKEEMFGLYSQMTRAAVSIPSNIAEGCSRNSDKDFNRFLEIALGSSFELDTQLTILLELNFLEEKEVNGVVEFLSEIQKMLQGLMKAVQKN